VVKLLKLLAASAGLDGRPEPNDGDFFVLKHIWNNLDQVELLEEIVGPVVDAWFRDRPGERRFMGKTAGLPELLTELKMIRDLVTGGNELSDVQMFSQLKNLSEIKAALQVIGNDAAHQMVGEVDKLLETVFASSKFGAGRTT
jgi:MoxR-like ATPase